MCCITSVGYEASMATTQLMGAIGCEVGRVRAEQARIGRNPPRMNWVVVTDENQTRRMQMHWKPSAGDR